MLLAVEHLCGNFRCGVIFICEVIFVCVVIFAGTKVHYLPLRSNEMGSVVKFERTYFRFYPKPLVTGAPSPGVEGSGFKVEDLGIMV